MEEDFGIYTDVTPLDETLPDGHRLYSATCVVCGTTVKRVKHDLKTKNKVCRHLFRKHGIKDFRINKIFTGMQQRCNNPKCDDYLLYGGKGIHICEEWAVNPSAFEKWALKNGYANNLTIDRIDSTKDYEPDNCRWVTASNNSRYKSTTHLITVNGETHTGREWAKICGLGVNAINRAMRYHPKRDVVDMIAGIIDGAIIYPQAKEGYVNAYKRMYSAQ